MKMELRGIKHAAFASEETNCYEAVLWIEGKAIAHVGNEGHGGSDRCDPAKGVTRGEMEAAIEAAIEARGLRAAYIRDMEKFTAEHGLAQKWTAEDAKWGSVLESWCGERVADWLQMRDLKRDLNRKVLFSLPGKRDIYQMKYKGSKKPDDALFGEVLKRHPNALILNRLPESEALAIYRRAAV